MGTPLVGGQSVIGDTTIDGNTPSGNYGLETTLSVSGNDSRRTLVRFDISQIPAGSAIAEARLRLRCVDPAGSPETITGYGPHRG